MRARIVANPIATLVVLTTAFFLFTFIMVGALMVALPLLNAAILWIMSALCALGLTIRLGNRIDRYVE